MRSLFMINKIGSLFSLDDDPAFVKVLYRSM